MLAVKSWSRNFFSQEVFFFSLNGPEQREMHVLTMHDFTYRNCHVEFLRNYIQCDETLPNLTLIQDGGISVSDTINNSLRI